MPANEVVIHVDANTAKAQRGLSGLEGTLKKVRGTALLVGGAIAAIGGFSIKAASDVEEMRSKFRVVFGELSSEVEDWAATTGKAVNRSRFRIMEYLSTLQDTFVPMGLARDQAADMSKALTELAIDVASFSNKIEADVIRDFQSALVGNTETVRKYGIVIDEALTKTAAYNTGIAEVGTELTRTQKLQARLNLLFAGSSDAIGDAVKTSESFANQLKGLQDLLFELRVEIGFQLLPVMTPLLKAISTVVIAVGTWAREHPELTSKIVLTTAALGLLALAVSGLGFVLGPLIGAVVLLKGALVLLVGVKLAVFTSAMVTLSSTAAVVAGQFFLIAAGVMAAVAAFHTLKESFGRGGPEGLLKDIRDAISGRGLIELEENLLFGRRPGAEPGVWERFGENFVNQFEVIAQKIGGIASSVTGSVEEAIEDIQNAIMGAPAGAPAGAPEDIQKVLGINRATLAAHQEAITSLGTAESFLAEINMPELTTALESGVISLEEFWKAVEDLKKEEIEWKVPTPHFDVKPLMEALGVTRREIDEVVDQLDLDLTKMKDRAVLTTILGEAPTTPIAILRRETELYADLMKHIGEDIAESFALGVLSEASAIEMLTKAVEESSQAFKDNLRAQQALIEAQERLRRQAASMGAGAPIPGVPVSAVDPWIAFLAAEVKAGNITTEEARAAQERYSGTRSGASGTEVVVNVDVEMDGKQMGEGIGAQVVENSR